MRGADGEERGLNRRETEVGKNERLKNMRGADGEERGWNRRETEVGKQGCGSAFFFADLDPA